jgi:hypothetical protein
MNPALFALLMFGGIGALGAAATLLSRLSAVEPGKRAPAGVKRTMCSACNAAAPAATERAEDGPLSREAWDARAPLPPGVLANALQDRVHADGPLISAAPVVTERAEDGPDVWIHPSDMAYGAKQDGGFGLPTNAYQWKRDGHVHYVHGSRLDAALRRAEAAEKEREQLRDLNGQNFDVHNRINDGLMGELRAATRRMEAEHALREDLEAEVDHMLATIAELRKRAEAAEALLAERSRK